MAAVKRCFESRKVLLNPSTVPALPRRIVPPSRQLRVSFAIVGFGQGVAVVASSREAAIRDRGRIVEYYVGGAEDLRKLAEEYVELHGATVFATYERPDRPARRVITACLGPER